MNTTYPSRVKSPYQSTYKKKEYKTSKHPAYEEIEKCLGRFEFSATFTEDTEAKNMFKDTPNLIAFVCTLKQGDTVIGIGRAMNALNQSNRYVEKSVQSVYNYSFLDSVSKATRILDSFSPASNVKTANSQVVEKPIVSGRVSSYKVKEISNTETEMISEKQKRYLTELIYSSDSDMEEKERLVLQLQDLSKAEASDMIQEYQR